MKNRTAVAYLLLLSMMPFFFVKAFHVHKERHVFMTGNSSLITIQQINVLSVFSLYPYLPKRKVWSTPIP